MIESYTLPEIGTLWEEEKMYQHWLEIELSACEARTAIEDLPEEILNDLYRSAKFDFVRCKTLEIEIHDPYQAFLRSVSESLGDDFQYFHRDITDIEVQDICLSMQMRDSVNVLLDKLSQVRAAVGDKARKYKKTLCIGRVDGIHTAPTTFGMKMASWYTELMRQTERLKKTRDEVAFGKVSGPVGCPMNFDERIEQYICMNAGLKVCPVAGNMLPRDAHAQYIATLAILSGTLERFANEIRTLQSSEFLEVEEPYHTGRQIPLRIPYLKDAKFSGTILSLAGLIRTWTLVSFEHMNTSHEGDSYILQSEYQILKESTILVYYMLELLLEIMQGLCVREERMLANLNRMGGLFFAKEVYQSLIEKGVSKDKAKMLVQNNAEEAMQNGTDFQTALQENMMIQNNFTDEEFKALFDCTRILENVDAILQRCGL